jgi:hypothetical protein
MKKIALTVAVVAGLSLAAYSQGQVGFLNANAAGYVVESSADHTSTSATGNYVVSSAFTAQLWALSGPTTTVPGAVDQYGYLAPSALVSSGFSFVSGSSTAGSAGVFSLGPNAIVPGTVSGNTVLAVVCWTGASANFASALVAYNAGTAFMGIFAFVNPIGPVSPTPYTGDISTGWNALQNSPRDAATGGIDGSTQDLIMTKQVAGVPEPSTLALAGLGGFGMLMAMRRKKA